MPIPWDKVILHGPQILDAARGLYGKWQTRSNAETIDPNAELHVQIREMARRLKVIEEGEEAQSSIIEKLAEQGQALTTGVSELKQQFTDLDARPDKWERLEASIDEQLKNYSARLDKLERVSAVHAKKLTLSLYAALGALAVAGIGLILLLTRQS